MKYIALSSIAIAMAANCYAEVPESVFNTTKNGVDYWSQEKINSAVPMELPAINSDEYQRIFKDTQQSGVDKHEEVFAGSDGEQSAKAAPGVPEIADLSRQPFKTAGKLFFTDDAGASKYCSAQFIKNTNVLLTAGHCVRNAKNKKWYTNFKFYPQYKNGSAGKIIGWHCATTWSGYTTVVSGWSQNWAKDYAFIYTSSASKDGYLGYKINNATSLLTAIGYPGNFQGGKYLMRVAGENVATGNQVVEMYNNPMRSGNSGGAWIINIGDSNTNGNHVVGINSFHYTNKQNSEFSPVFDNQFLTLLNFAAGKCSG